LSNVILVAASGVIVGVIGFNFLSAFVNFGKGSNPQQINKYVLVQVPCYTEGKESLETTLNSIAVTRYDDNYKLAIIVCDGLVTGKENSKPTPDMVLEILYGSEEAADEAKRRAHPPMTYFSVADGSRALNKGQIYSGIYEIEAHKLPFIVVIKTGNDTEKQKGNRGKRDSQILLMRFLNNIYARAPLTELEYALYREMKIVMGMAPEQFEYMLMVDADTSITRDSLIKMVHYMSQDTNTIGLCGETFVANEKESWTTMIQVYEYFISHHLAKAFESMFGAVTCLPGCFCMYRIRTDNNLPLLIAPMLIEDYADPKDNTLHKKNLLRLGEDRYLTTLVLKYFRKYKTRYTSDAQCYTNAPDTWSILVSQRRRWINSTVHNLMELILNIRDLCGFCCFSMRFVVLIDLLSTLVAPSAVVYVGYLIYTMIFERNEAFMISLIMIGAIYGLQLVIILLKRKWEHIMWMVIYVLAMPLFKFYLPQYSFWHMDDFKWGNTTVAIDDHGKEKELEVDEAFDPSCIERKKISQWEAEWKEDDDDLSAPASERTMSTAVRFPAASIHPMMPMASLHPMIPPPQTMMPPQPMPSSMMPNAAFSTYASSQVHTTMPMQQISVPYANYVPSHVASYVNSYRPAPPAFSHYATSEMLPRVPISRAGSYLSSECYPQESASNVGTTRKSRQPRQHKKKHGKKSRSDGSNEKYERDDGKGDGKDGRDGMKDGKDDGKDGKDGLKTGINLTLPEIPSMGTLF
jgi:chitin synthase